MVYNAMKLFMEVNPQLFDDCSHEYTEEQNNAEHVEASRKAKWDRISSLADSMKQNGHAPAVRPPGSTYSGRNGPKSPLPRDDADSLSQDSQQRMERLRLQDDRDRRPKDYERQSGSVR